MPIQVIAFDADDTLWINEPYFQQVEQRFCELLEDYLPQHSTSRELLQIEISNLRLYGYGIKSFMLSMIETALKITDGSKLDPFIIEKIIAEGKAMLEHPIELLDGIAEVLTALKDKYRLVVATKGDLLDQERKLKKSGLEGFFHHIEIMSDKQEADYQKLVQRLDIDADAFMMIGNSVKSDVLPVLNIGGHACHVPYHTTWEHEKVDVGVEHDKFRQLGTITEILAFL